MKTGFVQDAVVSPDHVRAVQAVGETCADFLTHSPAGASLNGSPEVFCGASAVRSGVAKAGSMNLRCGKG